MNQLPTYSKLIVNHYTNKPLLTVTTIVHMTIYFIYHPPSEHMGRDISTPLHSTSARIYLMCLQNVWAWIYALPFTALWPGYISCAFRMYGPRYMHSPSQHLGQDISHVPSERMSRDYDSGPAGKYHVPSERMGQDICTPLHSGPAGKYHMPLGTRAHGPSSVSQVIYH